MKKKYFKIISGLFIFVFVAAAFSNLRFADFVWDDFRNFVGKPHIQSLSLQNIFRFFTSVEYDNYFPFVWLSVALDYQLWGEAACGYHLTNIFLHCFASLLVFILLTEFLEFCEIRNHKISVGAAIFATLTYALHPLRVETVAWISARGDLLCSIFFQLSLLFYFRHLLAEKENLTTPSGRKIFSKELILCAVFCVLSLFCRAWAITFPLLLFSIDFECRRRFFPKTFIEKIPFVIFSAIFAIPAFLARAGGMPGIEDLSIGRRIITALYNFSFYPLQTIFPCSLSPLYPLENFSHTAPETVFLALLSIAILVYLIFSFKRALLGAYLSYISILLPVSGIVQSGIQYSADRYSYLSTIPLFAILSLALAKFAESRFAYRKFFPIISSVFIYLYLLLLPQLTLRQIDFWQNDLTLWNRVIESGNSCYTAFYNRGLYFANFADRVPQEERNHYLGLALKDFSSAVELNPKDTKARFNRGKVLLELGEYQSAIEDFTLVLNANKNETGALSNRALAYERIGKLDEAKRDLQKISELSSNDYNSLLRLSVLYVKTAEYDKAKAILDKLIEKNPSSADAYANRGALMIISGDIESAKRDLQKSLEISPTPQAMQNLKIIEEKEKENDR